MLKFYFYLPLCVAVNERKNGGKYCTFTEQHKNLYYYL